MTRATGTYERSTVTGEGVSAFVPFPLPPDGPPLALDEADRELIRRAERSLARLALAGELVPSLDWFLYGFVRKEAVVSSQIEGTQATLMDLLSFEARGFEPAPDADVQEVCNYLDGLSYARSELAGDRGLPISMRLLDGAHRRLMRGGRGEGKSPGEIRRSQNWVGGTRSSDAVFVPPPPQALAKLLTDFEHYLHGDDDLPALVRTGLLHVQFETIHPYLDGNGRIGRLLVTLLLEHWGLLSEPLLYLSLFFKRHRGEYYRRLSAVRTEGDWEGWIRFFLEGVATIADEAVSSARELFALVNADRRRVLAATGGTLVALRLFEQLPEHPILTTTRALELLDTTKPTAMKAMQTLVDSRVLVETTGRKRGQSFQYAAYLEKLRTGTELP